jgi:hypothetical protein
MTLLQIVSWELAEGSRDVPESSASKVEARREAAVSFTGIKFGTAGSCTADESKPNDGSTSALEVSAFRMTRAWEIGCRLGAEVSAFAAGAVVRPAANMDAKQVFLPKSC